METVLYLIRHGATDANLASPPLLQGRGRDFSLAALGVCQAEATRDFLALRRINHCYSSPMQRALETAAIVAAPHGLKPIAVEALTECHVGRWEGLDWETIRAREPNRFELFMSNPADYGYPEGESFAEVHVRVSKTLEELLAKHSGESLLVVGHHVVNRTYLAGLLGLDAGQARRVTLDNCGVSIIVRENGWTHVEALNAVFHLQGVAA
jgi:broad specificity phosphatase PhoE